MKNKRSIKEAAILQKFRSEVESFSFLKPRSRILIGCSGGADSVALVYLCASLPSYKFSIAHFNHNLRKQESVKDELFVKSVARKLGWKFYSEKAHDLKGLARNQKKSLEEMAREQRYNFLIRTARKNKAKAIFLAHHQNDQAETILMRMIQGTGLRGLLGIRPILTKEKLFFCRPLLSISRSEIEEFLKREKVSWREDSTNKDLNFLRNKIRLKLLPWLEKEMNPLVVAALARIPSNLSRENELIETIENETWKKVVSSALREQIKFKSKEFLKQPEAIQFRLVERALKYLEPASGLSFNHWLKLSKELKCKNYRAHLPKGIEVVLSSSFLSFSK